MIIATVMKLLHFRGQNRQVQVTCVDLGERLPRRGEMRVLRRAQLIQDPAGGKQVLDGFTVAHTRAYRPKHDLDAH